MRIILVIFPVGRYEIFTSLNPFFEKYPEHAKLKGKIIYNMTRKKQPFKHAAFKMHRITVQKSLT